MQNIINMKLLTEGTAWLSSKTDPRWNVSIRCQVGGFVIPPELEKKLEELKKQIGEEPPKDLEYEYMKD